MTDAKKPSLKSQGYPSWSFGHFWRYTKHLIKVQGRLPAWGVDHYFKEARYALKNLNELLEEWPLLTQYAEQNKIDLVHIMDVESRYVEVQEEMANLLPKK